jgi:hypothetical protein
MLTTPQKRGARFNEFGHFITTKRLPALLADEPAKLSPQPLVLVYSCEASLLRLMPLFPQPLDLGFKFTVSLLGYVIVALK